MQGIPCPLKICQHLVQIRVRCQHQGSVMHYCARLPFPHLLCWTWARLGIGAPVGAALEADLEHSTSHKIPMRAETAAGRQGRSAGR